MDSYGQRWLDTGLAELALATALAFCTRYVVRTRSRTKIAKDEIYFGFSLLFGLGTFLIGHFWTWRTMVLIVSFLHS
jgi:hypothetical protein